MAITSTPPPSNQINLTGASARAVQLIVGQTVAITVGKVEGNQVSFQLGGQQFTASSQQTLTAGSQLDAKVIQTRPSVILQIQPQAVSTAAKQEATIQAAYRQLLPNQIALNQGIQQLVQIGQSQILPAAIQTHLNSLLEQLFRPHQQMTSKELKAQLLSSGLFFENYLHKQGRPAPNDFKGKLLQLIQLLQGQTTNNPAFSKLSNTLGLMLNRITLQQVQMAENSNLLNIQLPLQPNDVIDEISIDIRKNITPQSTMWEVVIDLTLAQGDMTTKLLLQDDSISLSLWSDSPALSSYIQEKLPHLKTLFDEALIPLKQAFIAHQKPTASSQAQKVALIDIHI